MTTTVYLPGHFDLLHIGHLSIVRYARELDERLVLGVATNEVTYDIWGHVPVIPLGERLELVRHLRGVADAVVHDATGFDGAPLFDTLVVDDEATWDRHDIERLALRGVDVHEPTGLRVTSSPALLNAARRRQSTNAVA